jgi:surface protein
MTTAEYLTQLIDSKSDMKSAIESKGVAVTGGLSTYADAISKIIADGSDPYSVGNLKFGYSDFEYAPYIDVYTNVSFLFDNCHKLINIPYLDTSDVRYMHYMFQNCSSLTTIPQLNTSSVIDMSGMFSGCTSLTSIPQLDTSNAISMDCMFQG